MKSISPECHDEAQRIGQKTAAEPGSPSLNLRDLRLLGLRFSVVALLLSALILVARAGDKKVDVAKIHGRIQFVQSFGDYKVQAVTSFADLHVQVVKSFPDGPGKWQIVESFPDYKIQMVDSFPDFTIQFVTSFPGPAK